MKIQDVLSGAVSGDDLHPVSYFRGRVAKDALPDRFRLYSLPYNDSAYFLINIEDVAGDVYELTKEELIGTGFVGVRVYKVPLKAGTRVSYIKAQPHRVGETVDSVSFNLLPPGCHGVDCGGLGCCNNGTSGPCFCSTCCDAVASRGAPEARLRNRT